jgi:hypothetical protein
MKNSIQLAQLEKEYQAAIIAIKGYLKDAKDFNFEPTELKSMESKKFDILESMNELKK